eukprot:gb/GECH01012210.1/.p1 GENE.gb/GECH01012210.1/~~gb/GECH01012210.1/.p1  ORF type:complete len:140 (+),score=20.81 gb/GECH01012210.1/:1-420(+)
MAIDKRTIGSICLDILSLLCGLAVIVLGVFSFIPPPSFEGIVIAVYLVLFGAVIAAFSLFFPRQLVALFGFYSYLVGRGLFFIFLAFLSFRTDWYHILVFCVLLVLGAVFVILQFFPIVPPPKGLIRNYNEDPPEPNAE